MVSSCSIDDVALKIPTLSFSFSLPLSLFLISTWIKWPDLSADKATAVELKVIDPK